MTGIHSIAPVVFQTIAFLLFLAGAISFVALLRGAFTLRRLAIEAPNDDFMPLLKSRLTPAVTVILAPQDSGAKSRALTRRLLGLTFGNHEVVVALNAPPAADLAAFREEFHLEPSLRPIAGAPAMAKARGVYQGRTPLRLLVLDLEPASNPLALNAAVNAAQSPIIALFNGECEFTPEALLLLIRPMLEDAQNTVAVCGVAPGEPGKGLAQQFAALDFLRVWLVRAAAFSGWNLVAPPAGCALLVTREVLGKAGGFSAGALELVLQLHSMFRKANLPYRVAFVPAAGCTRREPESKADLKRAAALAEMETARCASVPGAFPPMLRAGWIGVHFVAPALETLAYALTIAGLIAGWVDWRLGVLMLLATVGLGMLLSMTAVSLRELAEFDGSDPTRLSRLFAAAITENLGFRQVRNLSVLARWARS
jgi:hypothetical protein